MDYKSLNLKNISLQCTVRFLIPPTSFSNAPNFSHFYLHNSVLRSAINEFPKKQSIDRLFFIRFGFDSHKKKNKCFFRTLTSRFIASHSIVYLPKPKRKSLTRWKFHFRFKPAAAQWGERERLHLDNVNWCSKYFVAESIFFFSYFTVECDFLANNAKEDESRHMTLSFLFAI